MVTHVSIEHQNIIMDENIHKPIQHSNNKVWGQICVYFHFCPIEVKEYKKIGLTLVAMEMDGRRNK